MGYRSHVVFRVTIRKKEIDALINILLVARVNADTIEGQYQHDTVEGQQ